jgi:hypothetical protein
VLVDICCELKGLEDADKANGWPHYRLIAEESLLRRGRGLRHWGAAGYRPSLDGERRDENQTGDQKA